MLGGQTCSNGKYLRDGLLIDIDTRPRTITEYRYDGGLRAPRLITQPDSLPAYPDGLCPMPGGESILVAVLQCRRDAGWGGAGDSFTRWRGADGMDGAGLTAGDVPRNWRLRGCRLRLLHDCGGGHACRRARACSRSGDDLYSATVGRQERPHECPRGGQRNVPAPRFAARQSEPRASVEPFAVSQRLLTATALPVAKEPASPRRIRKASHLTGESACPTPATSRRCRAPSSHTPRRAPCALSVDR